MVSESDRGHRTLLLKFSFGRPLWNSLLLNTLIKTAEAKIKNGSTDNYTKLIAIWCIRVGLTVNASSKIAEKLLRSHMATLLATSAQADRIVVNYSAEPALAIASRDLIEEHMVQYFKSLLKLVEGVSTDRGKIGESIFSEILLLAMDNSPKLYTFSEMKPKGASQRVIQILSTKSCLLEEHLEVDDGEESDDEEEHVNERTNEPTVKLDQICENQFRVNSVNDFLKTLYSESVFRKLEGFLPLPFLQGMLNFAQFISVHRNFPYNLFFDKNQAFEKPDDASGESNKRCF